jgi:hypothetical protein
MRIDLLRLASVRDNPHHSSRAGRLAAFVPTPYSDVPSLLRVHDAFYDAFAPRPSFVD